MSNPYTGTHYEVQPMSDKAVVEHRGPWVIVGPKGEEKALYFDLSTANRKARQLDQKANQTGMFDT